MSEEKDPLDEIFVESNEEQDKKIIAEILKPLVTIDPKGNLNFLEEYSNLTNKKKALVYLIIKKAMKIKGISEEEFALKQEASKKALISEDDANNAFCTTYKNLVENKKGKGYIVPDHKLIKVKEIIFEKENKNG